MSKDYHESSTFSSLNQETRNYDFIREIILLMFHSVVICKFLLYEFLQKFRQITFFTKEL